MTRETDLERRYDGPIPAQLKSNWPKRVEGARLANARLAGQLLQRRTQHALTMIARRLVGDQTPDPDVKGLSQQAEAFMASLNQVFAKGKD